MIDEDLLTLRRVRYKPNIGDSAFLARYSTLLTAGTLGDAEMRRLLAVANVFLYSNDRNLNRLGYRIVLQYAEVSGDYRPLADIATAKELMPILEIMAESQPDGDTFRDNYLAAYRENFRLSDSQGGSVRTRGQMDLRQFSLSESNVVVVAPTSYGKSEMMIERLKVDLDRASLVLVPTKALISQTKTALLRDPEIRAARVKILTHPDGFNNDRSFIGVMTQERFFRLMQQHRDLQLDLLLVDEAHGLLTGDERSTHLSQVIVAAQYRNPDLVVNFYTPFVNDYRNLSHAVGRAVSGGLQVQEIVKVERLYLADVRQGRLSLYEQFLDRLIDVAAIPSDERDFIRAYAGKKNVVYVNKPRQAEDLASALADALDDPGAQDLEAAARAIADLIHPEYSLVGCIKRGVSFHHGKMPELIRQYVERLFEDRGDEAVRFLVTTSTLLEGVNTPADTMFIANPKKGRSNLNKSEFRNLVGRVARFSLIFGAERDLHLLQPNVYVLNGTTAPSAFNAATFLKNVADVESPLVDEVRNPLLENSSIDVQAARPALLEYLENTEPGSSGLDTVRRPTTEIAGLCYSNNIRDFDIPTQEARLNLNLAAMTPLEPIADAREIMPAINRLFFSRVVLREASDLGRLQDSEAARSFYSMLIDWRSSGYPYARMVRRFLRYWEGLPSTLIYVGSGWGDTTYGDGWARLWVDLGEKTDTEKVNLAVAKVKEEQDFLDYRLLPYIEIMFQLGLVERDLFNRISYGTDDMELITLLRNGMSFDLARLIVETYRDQVEIDVEATTVVVLASLVDAMAANDENDILIFEAECHSPLAE